MITTVLVCGLIGLLILVIAIQSAEQELIFQQMKVVQRDCSAFQDELFAVERMERFNFIRRDRRVRRFLRKCAQDRDMRKEPT